MNRFAVLVALTCLAFPAACVHGQESIKAYLGEAQQSIHEKDYPAAIARLEKALSVARDGRTKAMIKNAIGWAYFSSGNITEGKRYLMEAYTEATNSDFEDVARRSANNLGLLAFSQDRLKEARGYFTSKWAKDSDTAKTYVGLIDSRLQTERVNTFISAGITYRLNRQFSEAVAEYDKALALDPRNVRALEYKGYALFRLGHYDEAMASFTQAFAVEPGRAGVLLNMLKTLCASKHREEARTLALKHGELVEASKQVFSRDGEFKKVCGQDFLSDIPAGAQPATGGSPQ